MPDVLRLLPYGHWDHHHPHHFILRLQQNIRAPYSQPAILTLKNKEGGWAWVSHTCPLITRILSKWLNPLQGCKGETKWYTWKYLANMVVNVLFPSHKRRLGISVKEKDSNLNNTLASICIYCHESPTLLSSASISGQMSCQFSALKIKTLLYPQCYYSISGSTTSLTSVNKTTEPTSLPVSSLLFNLYMLNFSTLYCFCSGPQMASKPAKSRWNPRVPGFT